MSNLSDLLPAGAAAKQLTFTDSGSGISSKAPVVLNSDGTVSGITSSTTTVGVGSNAVFESASVAYVDNTYDTANDRVCVVYRDEGNSNYGTAVVGSISGKTVTWGTPVVYEANTTTEQVICYDTNAGKVVIAFLDSSTYGSAIVGTIDAASNSISFGSKAQFHTSSAAAKICIAYDTTNQMSMIGYTNNGTTYPTACTASISGTSLTFGTPSAFGTLAAAGSYKAMTYDSSESKMIFAYTDGSNNGMAVAAAISGTGVIIPASVAYTAGQGYDVSVAYDVTANKTIILFRVGPANVGAAVVASLSGYTLTFGTVNSFETTPLYWPAAVYDSDLGKVVCIYGDSTTNVVARTATISSTSVSMSAETVIHSAYAPYVSTSYDSTNKVILTTFEDSNNSSYGTGVVYATTESTHTNLTAQAFVGVADSAISASAAGSIIVQGGTVSGVSSGTGVSAGTAVQYSASNLADVYAADSVYDSTNNKVVVVYDGAGAGAGYGIVATISGTSVSYGSAVQYSGGNARHSQVTYDSTNQRVVVAYSDDANSRYLTVAVGTVSGTSISWGTPVVADSTANDMYLGIDFDINAGKVLIIWKDDSTAYNYGIVGTVSGTSISFGTKATVDTSYGYQMIGGLTYDANAQKHLFFRPRTSGTVADGYVGTISGTSVSWGSATSATTTQSLSVGWGSYDSNAQKVVVTYRIGAGGMGSQVATISGTSVSFGTQVVVDASINPDFTTNYYDSTDQTIVAFGRATNYYGYVGTVSGTSISWSSASTLLLDAAFGYGLGTPAYDANADKGLILFANAGDSAAESAVTTAGALPLTTGTKYYVTTSGGFSSSADTPSVNAGLAISTTSLLLNGDS